MNKQELIEKVTEARSSAQSELNRILSYRSKDTDYDRGRRNAYVEVETWIEEFDEQPKVTVPQIAADWFEKNNDDLTFAIYEAVAHSIKEAGYKHYSDEFIGWFAHSDNNSIETLIRMKDGYEVEKLPVFPLSQGDLVIRKGKHEAKIYIVESVSESGVLLVNGIKDEFYSVDDEGGPDNDLDYFYSNFRLLAKKESLELEEDK